MHVVRVVVESTVLVSEQTVQHCPIYKCRRQIHIIQCMHRLSIIHCVCVCVVGNFFEFSLCRCCAARRACSHENAVHEHKKQIVCVREK